MWRFGGDPRTTVPAVTSGYGPERAASQQRVVFALQVLLGLGCSSPLFARLRRFGLSVQVLHCYPRLKKKTD